MYLEPCKLPWVASFNSPCASPNPCVLSRLTLSDLLFICPPDTLHPLHAGWMPLHTIHLNFPPLVLHAPPFFPILQTSPQLMKKMPKAQSRLLGLSITWKLTLPCYKLSKVFGPRIHILSHVSSPSPVLSNTSFLRFSVQDWCPSLRFTVLPSKSLWIIGISPRFFGLFVAELLMRSDGPIFWCSYLVWPRLGHGPCDTPELDG